MGFCPDGSALKAHTNSTTLPFLFNVKPQNESKSSTLMSMQLKINDRLFLQFLTKNKCHYFSKAVKQQHSLPGKSKGKVTTLRFKGSA